jgi:hypothetical protein
MREKRYVPSRRDHSKTPRDPARDRARFGFRGNRVSASHSDAAMTLKKVTALPVP